MASSLSEAELRVTFGMEAASCEPRTSLRDLSMSLSFLFTQSKDGGLTRLNDGGIIGSVGSLDKHDGIVLTSSTAAHSADIGKQIFDNVPA